MNAQLVWAILIGAQALVSAPFILYLIHQWRTKMALNFANLQAAATSVSDNAATLTTQAAASDDASNQAAIDAVTASLTEANTKLAALIVPAAQ